MPRAKRFGRPKKLLAVTVGLVIIVIVVWIVVPSPRDNESFYPSMAEAAKDGAIMRGWIPDDLLPPSARAIHEAHDLSPSTEWCAFDFAPVDSQNLRKKLKSVDVLPPSVRRVPNPQVSWCSKETLIRRGFMERDSNSMWSRDRLMLSWRTSYFLQSIGRKREDTSIGRKAEG